MNASSSLQHLISALEAIESKADDLQSHFAAQLGPIHPHFQFGARNLLDYLALRTQDIRSVQGQLAEMGLSSLGRTESHTRAALRAVLRVLYRLAELPSPRHSSLQIDSREAGDRLLLRNTDRLLGSAPSHRETRIMVTLPAAALKDLELIPQLVEAGMNCARINCAHDDPSVWRTLAGQVRDAAQQQGRDCLILMDLGGPKVRTGDIEPGPPVITWRIQKNAVGEVIRKARVALCPTHLTHSVAVADADVVIPLTTDKELDLQSGQQIHFRDLRNKRRSLEVLTSRHGVVYANASQRAYVVPGMVLKVHSKDEDASVDHLTIADFEGDVTPLQLRDGDRLWLTRPSKLGRPAAEETGPSIAHIPCTLPEIFPNLREGESIKFDDGKISGKILEVREEETLVEITQAGPTGRRLAPDKGINFPESNLAISGMVKKDLEDLGTIVELADMVALSFVNEAEDITRLKAELEKLNASDMGIVLKIETRRGFENLPMLLLAAMQSPSVGVMIARGDLGVECGWERMAELQEEILWLCEAAHIPVIWATQVLESLAKKGLPSRGEITDAAMSQRAECVMLNKGPHIVEAVSMLDDILQRMQEHQMKKTSMLRMLHVSNLLAGNSENQREED